MSTGADCHFTEKEPGQWFYDLQQWPYGEWPEYDTFGPFPTFEKASDHLHQNHANPGGFSIGAHPNHVHSGTIQNNWNDYRYWSCCLQTAS